MEKKKKKSSIKENCCQLAEFYQTTFSNTFVTFTELL